LFTYDVFSYAVSSADCTASNTASCESINTILLNTFTIFITVISCTKKVNQTLLICSITFDFCD